MGERHEHIFVVGAPGLSNLDKIELVPRGSLLTEAGFDPTKKVALFLYHPVLTEADNAGNDAVMMLDSMSAAGFQVVALHPNADAGNHLIKIALSLYSERTEFRILNHLSRQLFLSWMAAADVMVGNSSAGIIEAASFGTHVINVGTRQSLRERSANVIDVDIDVVQFEHRLAAVKAGNRLDARNVYGDGRSTIRILDLLRSLPLTQNILMKFNAY